LSRQGKNGGRLKHLEIYPQLFDTGQKHPN
jgi:hypothetical protein